MQALPFLFGSAQCINYGKQTRFISNLHEQSCSIAQFLPACRGREFPSSSLEVYIYPSAHPLCFFSLRASGTSTHLLHTLSSPPPRYFFDLILRVLLHTQSIYYAYVLLILTPDTLLPIIPIYKILLQYTPREHTSNTSLLYLLTSFTEYFSSAIYYSLQQQYLLLPTTTYYDLLQPTTYNLQPTTTYNLLQPTTYYNLQPTTSYNLQPTITPTTIYTSNLLPRFPIPSTEYLHIAENPTTGSWTAINRMQHLTTTTIDDNYTHPLQHSSTIVPRHHYIDLLLLLYIALVYSTNISNYLPGIIYSPTLPLHFGIPPPLQLGTPPPLQLGTPPPLQLGTPPPLQLGTPLLYTTSSLSVYIDILSHRPASVCGFKPASTLLFSSSCLPANLLPR